MSLDIALTYEIGKHVCPNCNYTTPETKELWSNNISANLLVMAEAADLKSVTWDAKGLAAEQIERLREGLKRLEDNPTEFSKYNHKSGWGDYDYMVWFISEYLRMCEKYPHATIKLS